MSCVLWETGEWMLGDYIGKLSFAIANLLLWPLFDGERFHTHKKSNSRSYQNDKRMGRKRDKDCNSSVKFKTTVIVDLFVAQDSE